MFSKRDRRDRHYDVTHVTRPPCDEHNPSRMTFYSIPFMKQRATYITHTHKQYKVCNPISQQELFSLANAKQPSSRLSHCYREGYHQLEAVAIRTSA